MNTRKQMNNYYKYSNLIKMILITSFFIKNLYYLLLLGF